MTGAPLPAQDDHLELLHIKVAEDIKAQDANA
jgi:hypothetical protein